jgi:HEPN domain-containing protein
MPLVQRIHSRPHTIAEFRRAATLRYREAVRLAVAGDRLAAIYLSGYAAEMLLKAAYFRLTGKKLHDPFIPSRT